uniref:Uncharacterized protein n=1 Tax=Anguilla anguilla TaxID=7936 RepID=A0A0E9WSA3_ANGAN
MINCQHRNSCILALLEVVTYVGKPRLALKPGEET